MRLYRHTSPPSVDTERLPETIWHEPYKQGVTGSSPVPPTTRARPGPLCGVPLRFMPAGLFEPSPNVGSNPLNQGTPWTPMRCPHRGYGRGVSRLPAGRRFKSSQPLGRPGPPCGVPIAVTDLGSLDSSLDIGSNLLNHGDALDPRAVSPSRLRTWGLSTPRRASVQIFSPHSAAV